MQSNNRVSRIRPPPSKSKSKTLKTIREDAEDRQDAENIMPPVPPSDLPPLKQSDSPEQDLALPYEPTKSLRMKDRKYESRLSTKKSFRNTKEWADVRITARRKNQPRGQTPSSPTSETVA